MKVPAGVEIKVLKSHPDQRGFFREILRSSDSIFSSGRFGQWSHSKMQLNVVKAWHYHHRQTDWWYVGVGLVEAVLYDAREESPTFGQKLIVPMGEPAGGREGRPACVRIPPGVLHGLKVLSDEAHLFYITSETYDPNDEGRLPFDSPLVPHAWGDNVITAENDRRTFVPPHPRVRG